MPVHTNGLIIALIHFHNVREIQRIYFTFRLDKDSYAFSPSHSYMKEDLPPTVHSEHNGHIHKLYFHQSTAHWGFLVHFTHTHFSECVIAKVFFIRNLSMFLDYNAKHDFIVLRERKHSSNYKELSTVKSVQIDTTRCYLPGGWTLLFVQKAEREFHLGHIWRDEVTVLSMHENYMGFPIRYNRPAATIDWLFITLLD